MLVMLTSTLAVDVSLIVEIQHTLDRDIIVKFSDGNVWTLYDQSKRYFNNLVKRVNEAQAKMTVKGSGMPQD